MFGLSMAVQTGAAMHSKKVVSINFIGSKDATNTDLGKGLNWQKDFPLMQYARRAALRL